MRTLTLIAVVLVTIPATARQRAVASHAAAARAEAPREIARVNGAPLLADRLEAAVNALIPQESFHRSVPPDKLAALRLQALDRLVDDELQYQEGRRRGIVVPAADVDAGIARAAKRYPSRQAFLSALARSGATLAAARREIRRSLVIERTRARALRSKCEVTRAEAGRYFAANAARFVVPEQLHVYAITIGVDPSGSPQDWAEARSRARTILAQARAGGSFEALAQAHSTDPSKARGGDMGLVHRGSLTPEFEHATRSLARGEVGADLVQTIYGFHIVKVADIMPPRQKTFAETAAAIQKDLAATRCSDAAGTWLAGLRAAATIQREPAP